ncbi:MAG TPA: DUF421 domain-containing protein [Bacillales bacterium]|nr:DUF421 domain-containing protein [Bacillales bacterium]
MNDVWMVVLKTLIGFSIMLILTRILGKKQISQMNFFTYITGITLGNIAAGLIIGKDVSIVVGLTGLLLWAFLAILVEYASLKSSKARVLLDGEPSIVIKNGVIQRNVMSQARLNMDDLSMMLRSQNVFSIREVDYAILEPNGALSVLKMPDQEEVTKADMQIPVEIRKYIPTELIVDGKIVKRNLRELNLDVNWLENQLQASGLKPKNVMFAELQSDGSLYVSGKLSEG